MEPALAERRRTPELMDDPELEGGRHVRALRALDRINLVSLAAQRVWAEVARLAGARDAGGPVRVLDVACGGGDVLRRVSVRAARDGVAVELHGCDVSEVALDYARSCSGSDPRLRWLRLDALRDDLPTGYDLVCSSLFLHHLDEDQAVALLHQMADATARTVLVQDLRRSRLGFALAWLGLHTLTSSDVARADGLTSVAAAFTLEEARALCGRAGLEGATVRACWPQRFTMRWARA
jgi:SAM-dependent methyltransferase